MNAERAREALHRLLSMFQSGDLPEAIARTLIRPKAGCERPCDKWSLGNRLLMMAAGTEDARGYRQWQEVGRQVKKGAKAIYIFAPVTKKKVERVTDPETGEEREEERTVVVGFRHVPVFRYEDTEGKPLPEPDYAPPEPPPLRDVAGHLACRRSVTNPPGGRAATASTPGGAGSGSSCTATTC